MNPVDAPDRPHYKFSFREYNLRKFTEKRTTLNRRMKLLTKSFAGFAVINFLVGNAYVLYRYIDIEVDIRKPRVSEYLLNRYK